MRLFVLALALLLVAAAGDVRAEGSTTTTRRDVLHAPMKTSGHLPVTTTCQPWIFYPDSDSWNGYDSTGAAIAVTQGVGTTFEETAFIPAVGGTPRYGARINAVGEEPYLAGGSAAAEAIAAIWPGESTVIVVAQARNNGTQRMWFNQGGSGVDGYYLYSNAANALIGVHSRAGASVISYAGSGSGTDRLLVASSRRIGTTCSTRANGNTGATGSCTSVVAPTGDPVIFGNYGIGSGYVLDGLLLMTAIYPCGLADAELTRAEALLAGSVAEERNITDDRNSTACWEAPDGYVYCVGDDMARCDSRGCLSEEQRINLNTNSSDLVTGWTADTATVGVNTASGPLSRHLGAAEVETVTATAGAGPHRAYKTFTATVGQIYARWVYAKAGTASWLGIRNGAYASLATFDLTNGVIGTTVGASTTSSIRAVGDGWYLCALMAPSTAIGEYIDLSIGTSSAAVAGAGFVAAGTETVHISHVQAELGSFPSQAIPTGAAAVTRLADSYSIPTHGFPTQQGEIETTFTPEWSSTANYAVSNALLTVTSGAFSGYGMFWSNTATGSLAWIVGKSDYSYTQISATKAQVAFSSTTYQGRWGDANQWLYTDKVLTSSNVGTAKIPNSTPATLTFGSNGWHRDVRVSR